MAEPIEFVPRIGPLCGAHIEMLPNAEWVLESTEESATGRAGPTMFIGESLRELDEYVLVEPPTEVVSGGGRTYNPPQSTSEHIPLTVRRRGDEDERVITLFVQRDQWKALAELFERQRKRFFPEE